MAEDQILFNTLIKILELDHATVTRESDFNLFEYDSFTKVNVIMAIEAYSETDQFELDELLECDTFQQVLDLANRMKL